LNSHYSHSIRWSRGKRKEEKSEQVKQKQMHGDSITALKLVIATTNCKNKK